ncbi:DUF5686 family protein [Candidatus Kapabacteria bacterium]|nr:DUF5686 family protein [Candidatus Kapabacteria bacterium]
MKFIIYILITHSFFVCAKEISISGRVVSVDGNKPIPYCTILNTDTRNGAYTDSLGFFSIKSKSGIINLKAFTTGFKSKVLNLNVENDTLNLLIPLEISDYETKDVVVFAEDLGTRMMRKILEKRKQDFQNLKTYTYDLYTKFVIATDTLTAGRTDGYSDTTINSILESYSKSYYKYPNQYFNNIKKKRQSINIPPQANFTQLDNRLNAWNNFIKIFQESIYSPFHFDAIDFYDFKFDYYQKDSNNRKLHRLSITPKGLSRKAFEGYILIDSLLNSPVYVNLKPSNRVQLPFNATMGYEQWFTVVSDFTMPTKLRIKAWTTADIFWVLSPRLDLKIENSQYNYKINLPIADKIFNGRQVEIDKDADTQDPNFWINNKEIVLEESESVAYEQIRKSIQSPDSIRGTNFITKQIAPITSKLRFINLPPFTGWQDIVKFNRVNGLKLGVGVFGNLSQTTNANLYLGYGISDKQLFYQGKVNQYFSQQKNGYFNVSIFNKLNRSDNPLIIKERTISIVSLIGGNDYGDYYYNQGLELSLGYGWGQFKFIEKFDFVRPNSIELFGKFEQHNTANVNSNFSMFNWNNSFRANPPAINNSFNAIGLRLNINHSRKKEISNLGIYLESEISNKSIGSSQNYERYYTEFNVKLTTLPLWNAKFKFSGAYSRGDIPFQKYYSIETSTAGLTAPGAMRTLSPKEYYGSSFAAVNFEHNFGEIFPGLLRIPNVASFGLEFIFIVNTAWSHFREDEIERNNQSGYNYVSSSMQGNRFENQLFNEVGIGLNKLFLFFRFDFMARVSKGNGPEFRITLSKASFN